METAQEWREFAKKSGTVSTVMSPSWLKEGCPKCDNKSWEVTSDCWAYCKNCSKGFHTDFPFTNQILEDLDFN